MADILEELQPVARQPSPDTFTPWNGDTTHGDPLLEALGFDPVSLDALGARTGWSAAALQARMLELELDGRVARLPGGLFQRMGAA